MAAQLVAVSFEVPDPAVTAAFWGAVLDRETVEESAGVLVPGDATQVGLLFVPTTSEKPESNRLHLHLTCSSEEDQRALVDAVLRSGGRRREGRSCRGTGRLARMRRDGTVSASFSPPPTSRGRSSS